MATITIPKKEHQKNKIVKYPFPVFISKEGKWFVAECPILGIATQGRSEEETKENMKELIKEYLSDPDTKKANLQDAVSSSFTFILVPVKERFLMGASS